MGGDDSQKLMPWRGTSSSPGRGKPPAHYEINTVTENGGGVCRGPDDQVSALSYRLPGSFLESRSGSLLESAEACARSLILAATFTALAFGDEVIPLGDGTIVIENAQFIRGNVAGLTFTLTNHTSSSWINIKLLFDITYVCGAETHQRSETVNLPLGWMKDLPMKKEHADLVVPLMGKVDGCKTQSIRTTLISAKSLHDLDEEVASQQSAERSQKELALDNSPQGDQHSNVKADENTGSVTTGKLEVRPSTKKSRTSLRASRRKRLAAEEEKRRQAEADARAAQRKADEEQRAAEASHSSTEGLIAAAIALIIVFVAVVAVVKASQNGSSHRKGSNGLVSDGAVCSSVPPPLPRALPPPASACSLKPVAPLLHPQPHAADAAKWLGADDSITVAGFHIPGFVYVGRNLGTIKGYDAEPALIDPSKPVAPSTAGFDGSTIPYWPSYSDITPTARHAYLKWHASGRSATDVPISFVFLYFYGLERRILHDYDSKVEKGEEYRMILSEVDRLLQVYGENHSFRRYGSTFLEMAQAISHHPVNTGDPPPDYPVVGYELPLRLKIALGLMARDGQPIPSAWACAWVSADPLFPRRTPFSRCNRYFRELFALRYRDRWGLGIVVKPNKTTIQLEYQPASASFGGRVTVSTDLPDITVLKEPIGKLRELGAECINELDPYSRYLGRSHHAEGCPAAMVLLPRVLLAQAQTGEAKLIREAVAARVSCGMLLSRDELVRIVKLPVEAGFVKRDAVAVAQCLASMGFGMEPDVRFGGPIPGANRKVYVFPAEPNAGSGPTRAYSAATLLIDLAVAVSVADGAITNKEQEYLQSHVASALSLSEAERARLNAHICWVLAEQPGFSGVKKRIEALMPSDRETIGRFLAAVASADGLVSPEEVETVGKVYRLLGLDADNVYSNIHQAATEPLTIQSAASPSAGFVLPPRRQDGKSALIKLDPALIDAKLQETAAASALLASVFVQESSPTPATVLHAEEVRESIAGLDTPTSAFLRYLSTRPAWGREELESAAVERSLIWTGASKRLTNSHLMHAMNPHSKAIILSRSISAWYRRYWKGPRLNDPHSTERSRRRSPISPCGCGPTHRSASGAGWPSARGGGFAPGHRADRRWRIEHAVCDWRIWIGKDLLSKPDPLCRS